MEIISKFYLFLLASGCSGCNGDGVYATITRVLFNKEWYDEAKGLVVEQASRTVVAGESVEEQFTAFAYYASGAPKAVGADKLDWALQPSTLGLSINEAGKVTGIASGEGVAIITVTAKDKPELTASATITVLAE